MPTITLRLDGETHAQLERRLARGDITQSDFVRSAITAKLASEAADQDRYDALLIALEDCQPTGETDLSTTYKTRIKEKLRAKHSR